MDRQSEKAAWPGRRSVAGAAIVVLAAAVPAMLQAPAIACRPVGGELPGIDCLAGSGLAAAGSWLFALFLGLVLSAGGGEGAVRSVRPAIIGLAVGGLVGFALLMVGGDDWLPHGLVTLTFGAVVLGPVVAAAIGSLLGAALVRSADTGG